MESTTTWSSSICAWAVCNAEIDRRICAPIAQGAGLLPPPPHPTVGAGRHTGGSLNQLEASLGIRQRCPPQGHRRNSWDSYGWRPRSTLGRGHCLPMYTRGFRRAPWLEVSCCVWPDASIAAISDRTARVESAPPGLAVHLLAAVGRKYDAQPRCTGLSSLIVAPSLPEHLPPRCPEPVLRMRSRPPRPYRLANSFPCRLSR
jgi:hypothetical protein